MLLRQLHIENFRGIRLLDWAVPAGAICLIGPGDAGKTTILDAIDLVLAGHYARVVHDEDFWRRDPRRPLVIDATVTGFPPTFFDENRYGLHLRGWSADGALHDEPADDDEPALTVRFAVDADLEPRWLVVTGRADEPRSIGWRDRLRLGAARVGTWVERDLRWVRGSALARLTGDVDDIDRVLADAQRAAREAVGRADLKRLRRPIEQAGRGARDLGAGPVADNLHAGLDSAGAESRLSLHSSDIPVRVFGQGSRRLTALGLQLVDAAPVSCCY